jgi:hypothetical protein
VGRAQAPDGSSGQVSSLADGPADVSGSERSGTPAETKPPIECDACGAPVVPDEDDGYSLPGEGVYLWTRGDEVRFERAPLCASCAAAIGMAALARWEIEEEEG